MNIDPNIDQSVLPECSGCKHIVFDVCDVWVSPYARWQLGQCPNDTKYVRIIDQHDKKLNPIKASKKKARKK